MISVQEFNVERRLPIFEVGMECFGWTLDVQEEIYNLSPFAALSTLVVPTNALTTDSGEVLLSEAGEILTTED